ncbi:MAG TPA: LysR family transcriptional regulator [Caulobacteraceae bacterium]|jgi:DNA-binding transcriptional LysR family regulator
MWLRQHNLNLLPILRELLVTRSVSRTAERVGLSQSAVSAALARLREVFDDELLVMVGRRMELTERGELLIEQTERAHREIEALLSPRQFDPGAQTRRFVIATADYVTLLLAPRLAQLMSEQAPHASVHFIDVPGDLRSEIGRGAIDIVVVPESPGAMPQGFDALPLFKDEIVVIASLAHAPFSGELTREVFEASRHATFQMSPKIEANHSAAEIRELGLRQRNLVVVQQFAALPAIVEATSCLALMQRRLAERFAKTHAISIHPPPFPLAPLEISAFSERRLAGDPAHTWFRGLLKEAAPT